VCPKFDSPRSRLNRALSSSISLIMVSESRTLCVLQLVSSLFSSMLMRGTVSRVVGRGNACAVVGGSVDCAA